jgi:two-component system OmpR family sensor kinase
MQRSSSSTASVAGADRGVRLWCDRGRMRRRLPIRLRLTIAFAGVLAAVLGAAGVVLYTELAQDLDDTIDAELRHRTVDFVALVGDERVAAEALAEGGEPLTQLYDPSGRLIASTRQLAATRLLNVPEVRRAAREPVMVERRPTQSGDVRVLAQRAPTAADREVVAAVGNSLTGRDDALDRLQTLLLLVGPLALLLASYAGYQVAGAALRPVERMRQRAAQITEHDAAERLPVPDTGDEIEALGRTFNELLGRLDAALARERRLLSDASHELRTPLTVLRTGIQVALRRERDVEELRAALESAEHEAGRVTRIAEDLLVVARADQGRLPLRREALDTGELLEAAVLRARPAAEEAGRELRAESDGSPSAVLADRDRANQALDNLVANALAHGSGSVRLVVREAGEQVELHVIDEGPGFPEDLKARAFERFSRGEEARSSEGSGLGLAIVAAIARAHGGDAGARNLPGGGADVWITLPVA